MKNKMVVRLFSICIAAVLALSDVTSTAFCDVTEQTEISNTDIFDEDNTETEFENEIENEAPVDAENLENTDEVISEIPDEASDEESPEPVNEETEPTSPENVEVIYGVGPAYIGIYTEEDARRRIEEKFGDIEDNASEIPSLGDSSSKTVNSLEEAGEYLRTMMSQRGESFSFTTSEFYDYYALMDIAMEETDNPKEGDYIRANLLSWGMSLSSWGASCTYECYFVYTANSSQEQEVDKKVAEILSQYGLNSESKTDYEKVKIIHDYLCRNASYSFEHMDEDIYHSSYGALIMGSCVCQGYAGAFYRLCEESGIDARYITGMAEGHAWNICRVGRYYYNVDVTWDDQYKIFYDYFLKNNYDFSHKGFAGSGTHIRDDEFCSEEFMQKYPMSETSFDNTPPAANSILVKISRTPFDEPEKTFSKNSGMSLTYGDKFYVDAKAVPNSMASDDPKFTDKVSVAVSEDSPAESLSFDPTTGYISANKPGKAKLTFASVYTPTCKLVLSVEVKPIHISSITLNKNFTELQVGDSENLTTTILPQFTSDERNVIWTSSDTNIVSVDEFGKITAVGCGSATVTATTSNNLKAQCKVTTSKTASEIFIADAATGVKLQPNEERKVYVGESVVLKAVADPYNADYLEGISWEYKKANGDTDTGILSKSMDNSGMNVTLTGKETGKVSVTLKMAGKETCINISVEEPKINFYLRGGSVDGKSFSALVQRYTYGQPIGEMPVPEKTGDVIFAGWYTQDYGEGEKIESDTVVRKTMDVYAYWESNADENMWISTVNSVIYTGTANKPQIKVYDGNTVLQLNKDYTVTYKNNTKVYSLSEGDEGFDAKKAPSVTIKGKGNYTDTLTEYFTILPKDINDSSVTYDSNALAKAANGKTQYPVPTLKMGTTTLKKGTDYTLEYPDTVDGAYIKPGRYNIVVKAKEGGNFTGSRTIMMTITRSDLKSIAKCTVSKIPDQNCVTVDNNIPGKGIFKKPTGTPIRPTITVKDGKNILTEGVDYTVAYFDNILPGTARAVISGKGNYNYSKTVNFKIKGIALDKNIVNLEYSYYYNGSQVIPVRDLSNVYTVSYLRNIDVGTATLTLTGVGAYTGTIKKTFRIYPTTNIEVFGVADQPYVKGGCTPKPDVYFGTMKLTEGKDYTLSYANNKAVSDTAGNKKPTFTVTGKGNFKGAKVVKEFTIKSRPISQCSILVPNVVAQPNKSNVYKPKFVVKDINGQELKAGTDYDSKNIEYVYLDMTNVRVMNGKELTDVTRKAKEPVDAKDIIPPNTRLGVRINGINNYYGLLGGESEGYAEYMITAYDISKAKATIKDQTYTGKTVTLKKSDIVLTLPGSSEPIPAECYEIMSYTKNDKVGTATVTIKGLAGERSGRKGDYAGTKSINFKIKGKSIWAKIF